jgi:hypothetical protein
VSVTVNMQALPFKGARVRRGKDWKWDDQDGGRGKLGTVDEPTEGTGWVGVKWDSGRHNSYRWGVDGCYDLELASSSDASE